MKEKNDLRKKIINKNNIPLIIVFLSLFIYLISGFNYDFKIYDEGIAVFGAFRVAQGELPYLDFWTIYPPGQYFLLAALFKVFGFELLTERTFSIFLFFLTSIILYKVSYNLTKSKVSIISSVVYIFFISFSTMYGTAMGTSLLFALLSVFYFHKWLDKQNTKFLFMAAILSGLTSIFRLDIGVYSFVANLILLLLVGIINKSRIKLHIKNLLIMISGFACVFVPVYSVIIIMSGFDNVVEQLIIFPSKVFPDYRSIPFPNPFDIFIDGQQKLSITGKVNILWNGLVFYLPLLIYLSTITIIFKNINGEISKTEKLTTLHLAVTGLLFYFQASIRSDIEHLLPTLFLSMILFTYLFFRTGKKKITKIVFALMTLFMLSVPIYKKLEQNTQNLVLLKIPRINNIAVDPLRAYEINSIHTFVINNINIDEEIFIGNSRHDMIYINDVMLYFILNRNAGTKYHELSPGQVTSEKVQLDIIKEFQKNKAKFIILKNHINQNPEKNLSAVSSGVSIIDDYISVNYESVFSTPNYIIKKLKIEYEK